MVIHPFHHPLWEAPRIQFSQLSMTLSHKCGAYPAPPLPDSLSQYPPFLPKAWVGGGLVVGRWGSGFFSVRMEDIWVFFCKSWVFSVRVGAFFNNNLGISPYTLGFFCPFLVFLVSFGEVFGNA